MLMLHYYLCKLLAHGVNRVEGSRWILRNVGDFLPPNMLHLRLCQLQQASSLEFDFPVDNLSRTRNNSHDRLRRNCLTRSRFSHEAECLSLVHVETHTIDCLHDSCERVEVRSQSFNTEKRGGRQEALFPQPWVESISQTVSKQVEAHYKYR